jgi:hypothetical protein
LLVCSNVDKKFELREDALSDFLCGEPMMVEWSVVFFTVVKVLLLELLLVLRKEYASGRLDLSFFPSTPSMVRFLRDSLEEE